MLSPSICVETAPDTADTHKSCEYELDNAGAIAEGGGDSIFCVTRWVESDTELELFTLLLSAVISLTELVVVKLVDVESDVLELLVTLLLLIVLVEIVLLMLVFVLLFVLVFMFSIRPL